MKKFVIVFFEKIAMQLIGIFMPFLLVRILSPSEYGLYKTLISYLVLSAFLIYFSLESVLIRYLPELNGFKHKNTNRFIYSIVFLRLATIVPILLIIYIFRNEVLGFLEISITNDVFVNFLLLIFFTSLTNLIGRSFYTANGWRHKLTYIIVTKEGIKFIGFVVLFLLIKNEIGHVILILLTIEVSFLLFYFYSFFKKIGENKRNGDSRPLNLQSRTIRYGMSNLLWNSFQSMRDTSIDIAIITTKMSAIFSAYYGAGVLVPNLIRGFSFFRIFHGVILPKTVELNAKESNSNYLKKTFNKFNLINKYQFALIAPGLYLVASISYSFVIIYFGEEYAPAVEITYVILISIFFVLMSDVYYLIAQILEKNKVVAFATTVTGAINLILDLLLIKNYGILGVAIATCTASVLSYLFLMFYFRKVGVIAINDTVHLLVFILIVSFSIFLFNFHIILNLGITVLWLSVNYFYFLNKIERRYISYSFKSLI